VQFQDPDLLEQLSSLPDAELDQLQFGAVRMNTSGIVNFYNAFESSVSCLHPDKALGRNFFEQVAPCTNNFMVAERMLSEPELDAILPYVFTFRLKPTPVRLRLLRSASRPNMFLLVEKPK
jgi:photoactive yellow protein